MVPIRWAEADKKLLENVRSLQISETQWSTAHQAIIDLRTRLLKLQKSRCAYCQGPIESTANGFIELDHILPKAQNGKDIVRMQSDEFKDRLVTPGYSCFMYEPQNLVVTCRACNSAKNSFDPLRLRSTPIGTYPTSDDVENLIKWYHPHFQSYESHITRNPDWTFKKESDEGDFTIRACKLHIPEQLNKRFQARADASLEHSPSVRIAINALATSISQNRYGLRQGIVALVDRCNITESMAETLILAWKLHVETGTHESLSKANKALQGIAISWEGSASFDASAKALCKISKQAEKGRILTVG
jgi:hypothetical protein